MATYKYATKELSITSAKAFLENINADDTSTVKKSAIIYAVLGHSNPWNNEPSPDQIVSSTQKLQYETKRDFIGGKKVDSGNVSHVTKRVDWSENSVYDMYKDTLEDVYDTNYFVVTDELNVYKCLYNNKRGQSTIKPQGYALSAFTLSDGYTWKYMYSITLGESEKFMTTNHIPVKIQSNVQTAAVNGNIEIIETNTSGSGYYQLDGVDVATSTSNTLIINGIGSGAYGSISRVDDFYNGSSVYIKTGTGSGQLRRITNYVGETKELTVNTAFTTIPENGDQFLISPTATIIGDGKDAKAYTKVNVGTGAIANVSVIDTGEFYTRAETKISGGQGTGATANTIISPKGGHGSDAITELGADKLMINVKFDGSEGISSTGAGYIPANTEFRTISLLKDPILKVDQNNAALAENTEAIANTSNSPLTLRFTHRARIAYESLSEGVPTNALSADDIITNERMRLSASTGTLEFVTELTQQARDENAMANALQGANAQIVYIRDDESTSDVSFYTMYLNNVQVNGDNIAFVTDDAILKQGSDTKIAIIQDYKFPEANTFSGEVLYTENVGEVTRSTDQLEDIKIILDF